MPCLPSAPPSAAAQAECPDGVIRGRLRRLLACTILSVPWVGYFAPSTSDVEKTGRHRPVLQNDGPALPPLHWNRPFRMQPSGARPAPSPNGRRRPRGLLPLPALLHRAAPHEISISAARQ
jgi:hypothetical protein